MPLLLNDSLSLLINGKTHIPLSGTLLAHRTQVFKGRFKLPNRTACVDLLYHQTVVDRFCYSQAQAGVKLFRSHEVLQELSPEMFRLLKALSLSKIGDQLCMTYQKIPLQCKKLPASKNPTQQKLLSFQNSFISQMEQYLQHEYRLLFYQSELQDLFSYYRDVKSSLRQ